MGDEFQSGICGGGGGNWWNNPATSKSVFGSSPCSSVIINSDHNMGIRGYSSATADESCSVSDGSIIFHDIQKPQPPEDMVVGGCGSSGSAGGGGMDSTLQMMCIGLSSSTTTDWDHESLLNGKAEGNYHHHLLQEEPDSTNLNYGQENEDWGTPKNFIITSTPQDSSIKSSLNQLGFSITSSDECNAEALATSFPMSYPSTTLLQTIFDTDSSQASQSQFDNSLVNYSSNNYRTKLNEFSPSFPKFSSFLKSSLQQKPQSDHLPFYNMASAGAPNDTRANFFPLMQPQFYSSSFEEKPSCPNLARKADNEEVGDSGSVVKKSCTTSEPAFKRPRIQAPSPLPTFKVRKEKLGDRITALQQLVSPFGKTDTASVLHEAIEYIKLLHHQVHVLSAPYLKHGSPLQLQQTSDKVSDNSSEGANNDLRSRGLCLVPISSTFPVAAETSTTPDFWAPTFGATFR